MIKHKVYVKRQRQGLGEQGITSLCRRAIKATLLEEGIDIPVEVNVLVSDDKGIREINREHREKDEPTDVISFPAANYAPGAFQATEADIDPETGCVYLGDIVVSNERAVRQAEEYGHEVAREIAYLIVHATLHLLGYDHMEEGAREQMRIREERILGTLGLTRNI
ncbi:MAG: rRNA maturation RNase YbeY [Oscillospiraceae bacterium]|nr:rRNA maturation RNase YbeY [Oscillospiraceae bacterium]